MAKSYLLEIVTPEKKFFSDNVEMLVLNTLQGSIGILANHTPMVAAVVAAPIKIQINGKAKVASVASGFVQIDPDKVVLLVDSAEWPEEIDENRALEAKKRAEERLHRQLSSQEYAHTQAALSRALARLITKHR